jgi:ABC-2 type transport system permease protein
MTPHWRLVRLGFWRNAVIGKELRTRMRGWRSVAVLTAYMAVLGAIAIAFLFQQAGPTTGQSSQVGVQLFQVLAGFQLFLILFVTPASTAAAISGERQRQTWDLLLVTRLSAFGIVLGKLAAGLAFNLLLLLASLPLFSLIFLFGGVAPDDVIHTYAVFLATILLLGVISLLVSALGRRVTVTMIVSNVLALLIGVGLSLLTLYLENWGSPAYGPRGPIKPPPLTPLAELDPFAALLSALPGTTSVSQLGQLQIVHHAFGLPFTMHLWEAYFILATVLSVVLLAITTLVVRFSPGWLSRTAA